MKWITRSHVHVDRVACPWLIARFIDSDAEFLFVPKCKVLAIAEKEGAIPFDTPGAMLHHRDDLCTFDAISKDYELTDKALLRIARVINAADTNRGSATIPWPQDLRPLPWATACASRMTWRTSSGSSRFMTPWTPGADWRWPKAINPESIRCFPNSETERLKPL